MSGAMDTFGEVLSNGLTMVIDKLPGIIDAGAKLLETLVNGILDNADKIIDAGIQIVELIGNSIITNIPKLLMAGFEVIEKLANSLVDNLPTLVPAIVDVLLEIAEIIVDNIDMIIDVGGKLLMGLMEGLMNALPKFLIKAPEIIVKLVRGLSEGLQQMTMVGMQLIGGLIEGIGNALPALGVAVYNLVESIVGWFKDKLGIHSPSTVFTDFGKNLIQGLINGILSLMTELGRTTLKVVDNVSNAFTGLMDGAKSWGKDMLANFIDGIKEKWNDLKEAVSNVANTIKDYLGFSEPKEGPLSNFHTFAPDMIDLWNKTLEDNSYKLQDQFSKSFDFADEITMPAGAFGMDKGYGIGAQVVEIVDAIREGFRAAMDSHDDKPMIFPIYIGGHKVDEVIVGATNAYNYRSGGR